MFRVDFRFLDPTATVASGGVVSLLAPYNTIELFYGATKSFVANIFDSLNNPLNITGGRIVFGIKKSPDDPALLVRKTTDSSSEIQVINPRIGQIQVFIQPTDSKHLEPGTDYFFDLWYVSGSGDKFPLISEGSVRVKPSIVKFL